MEYDAQPPTITGHVELADELLEVERLAAGSCDTCSAETTVPWIDEDVELGLEHVLGVLLDALRRERRAGDDAGVLDLTDALRRSARP